MTKVSGNQATKQGSILAPNDAAQAIIASRGLQLAELQLPEIPKLKEGT
jgi:hypothetical protein